jgi:hypothetical protein
MKRTRAQSIVIEVLGFTGFGLIGWALWSVSSALSIAYAGLLLVVLAVAKYIETE